MLTWATPSSVEMRVAQVNIYGSARYAVRIQADPAALEARQLSRQRHDFLVEFLARVQTIFAGIGVDAEIADQRRRHGVEGDAREERFKSRTRDHGQTMLRRRLIAP